MIGLAAMLLLAQAASLPRVVDFGVGTLTVPDGCTHRAGQGVDSAVGSFECGDSRIRYDIARSRGPSERGWCTAAPRDSEFPPGRVTELRTRDGRTVFVCDLPRFAEQPPRLVAVVSPHASFHSSGSTPADATWLLTVALAFRAP